MAKTYAEKLRDPRWQKRRLEIFQRDNWTCQICSRADITLNVHHLAYNKGSEPWDYSNDFLETLCEECHQEETGKIYPSIINIGEGLKRHRAMSLEINTIAGLLQDREPDREIPFMLMLLLHDEKVFSLMKRELKKFRIRVRKNRENGKTTD